VAEESAGGFRFRLLVALANDRDITLSVQGSNLGLAAIARQPASLVFQVSWLGVEPVDGCAPPPRWDWLIRLIGRRFIGTITTPGHFNFLARTDFQEPTP
jgi:hypothetical protein